ncbi:MAG TPA: hypothetical protein VFG48_06175, partial [Xanthomonadales bacterium]|nr:hypothetical protein [Xanthomonadales bacterium]
VLPEDYDADTTHVLAVSARRNFSEEFVDVGIQRRYVDNYVENFVPSAAAEPMPRDIVTTDTCNRCHGQLAMHGGGYTEVQVCQHCHNPEYMGQRDVPERAFNVMIHELHSGQLVDDGEVHEIHYPVFPGDQWFDCEVCHTGGTPTADRPLVANPNPTPVCDGSGLGMTTLEWGDEGPVEIRLDAANGKLFGKTNGAGSKDTGKWVGDGKAFYLLDADNGETLQRTKVHTTVNGCLTNPAGDFRGTAGALHSNWLTKPQRGACGGCHVEIDWETGEGHGGGPAEDDAFCSFCHQADSGKEYDRSVRGAHTVEYKSSQLDGLAVEIKSVTNTGPGQFPKLTFAVLSKNGRVDPNTLDRMRFHLAGPNEDFDFYAREDALGKAVASGTDWTYTFATRIPMDAVGSFSITPEARAVTSLVNAAGEVIDDNVRDSTENYLFAIAVSDTEAKPRQKVVDDAKCESCHSNLAFHGGNRHNGGEMCMVCHRPGEIGEGATETEEESIHFKYMIHKIHAGANLEYGFAVGGHIFDEVHFPGELKDCANCHVDVDPDEDDVWMSHWLPLPEGRLPTMTPNGFTEELQPIAAACLSCHDGLSAAQHADANTSDLGESCSTCHGQGKTYSVERVHAR